MQMPNHKISSLGVQFLFSLAMALLPFHAAISIPVDNLYVAEVLVPDESDRRLKTGAKAGLLQVLVRASGSITVEQSSLVRSSLRNPAAYYYQYMDLKISVYDGLIESMKSKVLMMDAYTYTRID